MNQDTAYLHVTARWDDRKPLSDDPEIDSLLLYEHAHEAHEAEQALRKKDPTWHIKRYTRTIRVAGFVSVVHVVALGDVPE